METVEAISLMLGAAWASGINLYAAIFVLGWFGSTGQVDLPPDLEVLTHPTVMFAAGTMYVVEFFADKIPGFDTFWDGIHTFIRIPAGALLAAGAAQGIEVGQAGQLAALLLGGSLAATTHTAKAGTRVLINTSPEPVSNWTASVAEDLSVIAGLWAALNYPWLFVALLIVFLLVVAWALPRIWRAIKKVARAIRSWWTPAPQSAQPSAQRDASTRRKALLSALYDDDNPAGRSAP